MTNTEQPLISIIMATYNRSNVLTLAIESVVAQTYEHWELIVVGDACTDDTEDVVAAFNDPRIRFINLEQNIGEQSGPNNIGFEQATGELIAYLNHDDLWFPDHLEVACKHLQATGADMVYTLANFIHRDASNEIGTVSPGGSYHPTVFAPASCWLIHRAMVEKVGAWRFYRSCHLVPSQDWLYRAWKQRKTMLLAPSLTVVAIQSGKRRGVYANRESEENEKIWARMQHDPGFRHEELANYLASQPRPVLKHYSAWQLVCFAVRNAVARVLTALGCHPYGLQLALRYKKKGALIDRARYIRGLEPLPESNKEHTHV